MVGEYTLSRVDLAIFAGVMIVTSLVLAVNVRRVYEPKRRAIPPPASCGDRVVRVELVGGPNPALVAQACIGSHHTAFLIDTGYAGAPCLSLVQLSREGGGIRQSAADHYASSGSGTVAHAAQHAALLEFIRRENCVSFTAGCSQTLMGIGASTVSTSDILLGPPLTLCAPGGGGAFVSGRECAGSIGADVYSTTPMDTTHILTLDWLRQVSPCLLQPSRETLEIALEPSALLRERPSFTSLTREMSGGAFVATVTIGRESFSVTVDTGAACYVALSSNAAQRLRSCSRDVSKHVRQRGANGEQVCGDIVTSSVTLGGHVIEDVPVYVNSSPLFDVDGYIGLAYLRHFDLLILDDELLIRRNDSEPNLTLLDAVASFGSCGEDPPRCGQ